MELLYLTDISHVQYILDKKPQLFETMQPITGDIVVASELERLNIPFIDEWDFLEPIDIERNADTANNLATIWWDEHIASTEYEGFALSDCAGQDLVYPFEACLNARIVYERIFKEYPIERISGYFLPTIGVIRTGPIPTHRTVRSVTQAVLFWLADKNNIPYNKLESEYSLSQGTLAKNPFSLENYKATLPKKSNEAIEKIALIINDVIPERELEVLKDSFEKLDGWKAIALGISDLKYIALGHNGDAGIEKRLQYSWETFNKTTANYEGPYPEIFANHHLSFQFKRIWDEMKLAADYGNVFSTFLDILKPSVILLGHEAFTIERVLVRLAQKKNIPTVGLLHGGLGYRFGHRGVVGDADSVLVWNDIDISILDFFGVNKSRLHKIGCIRYEPKFKKYSHELLGTRNELKSKSKQQIGISSDNPVILILTAAINAGFSAPIASPRKHRETLNELLTLIRSRKDLTFIIKAHPGYDYYELYRKMYNLLLPNLIFCENATLDEALDASDVCLMLNYFTTAALEAMLHHLPVIYLNTAVYPLPDRCDNVPDFMINRIYSIVELEKKIDGLLSDKVLQERTYDESDKVIRQLLDVSGISANDRLIHFLKSINTVQQYSNISFQNVVHTISSQKISKSIKDETITNYLNEITLYHPIGNILHVFSFLAGASNLDISSSSRIFHFFQKYNGKENLSSWQDTRWVLLPSFISGYNNNSTYTERYSSIRLIGLLIVNPKKFIYAPIAVRHNFIKYFATGIIGNNRILAVVINWVLYILKKYFR